MDPKVIAAAKRAATKVKVPFAHLMAVIEVESAGKVFAVVDGKNEPLIRFEGHYFFARTKGAERDAAVKAGLASPNAGAVKNPNSQQARWDRLLKPAMAINRSAALESVSWGLGQVMGSHWKTLGFKSADDMVDTARSGIDGQIDLMVRYCHQFDLLEPMRRGDFAAFARGYNGPNYRKYSYDTKMAAAAKRYAEAPGVKPITEVAKGRADRASAMIRLGTEGAKVREVQTLLVRAGYAVPVDGDFGPATDAAVRAFQKEHKLEVDGLVGPDTEAALAKFRADPEEQPGVPGAAETLTQTPEGRQGAATAGGGLTTLAAKEGVQEATAALSTTTGTSQTLDMIYLGLTILGVVLTLGGIVWIAYGYFRANSTRGVKGA